MAGLSRSWSGKSRAQAGTTAGTRLLRESCLCSKLLHVASLVNVLQVLHSRSETRLSESRDVESFEEICQGYEEPSGRSCFVLYQCNK